MTPTCQRVPWCAMPPGHDDECQALAATPTAPPAPGYGTTAQRYCDAMTVRRYLRTHVPQPVDRDPWEAALEVTLRDVMRKFMAGAQVIDVDERGRPSFLQFMDGSQATVDADGVWLVWDGGGVGR